MRAIVAIFLVALGLTAGASVKSNSELEKLIIGTIECVRDLMHTGWPEHDLPTWTPLIIEDLELDFSIAMVDGLSGFIHITDATIANVPDFKIASVSGTIGVSPPSYTVNILLTFDRLDVETNYDLDLKYDDYELFGKGIFRAGALNSSIVLSTKVTMLGAISLEYFDVWLDMNGLNYFEVTGVRGDEEYSQQVTDYVIENWQEVVAGLAPIVHDIASEATMNLINEVGLGELLNYLYKCLGSR